MAKPLKDTLIAKLLEGRTPQAAPEGSDWLHVMIDEQIERDQPFWRAQSTFFRASSCGEPCIRALTFNAMGHNVPHEARMLRLFGVGNAIEANLIPVFESAGVLIDTQGEVIFEEDGVPMLVGHYDLLIKRRGTEERWLGEIKSINLNRFTKLPLEHASAERNVNELLRQHPKYVIQWTVYAASPQVDTNRGFLLFEHKNDSAQKIYELIVNQDLLNSTMAKVREAWQYIRDRDNQRLAPVPVNRDPNNFRDPVCKWCPAAYLCRRLPDGEVSYDDVRAEDAKLRG